MNIPNQTINVNLRDSKGKEHVVVASYSVISSVENPGNAHVVCQFIHPVTHSEIKGLSHGKAEDFIDPVKVSDLAIFLVEELSKPDL